MASSENNDYSISPTHYGVAKFIHHLYKNEYKYYLVGRSKTWHQKQEDGTFKDINSVLIRNRISTDIVSALGDLKNKFKNDTAFGLSDSVRPNSRSLEALQNILNELNQRRQNLINQHPQIEDNQTYQGEGVQDPITYSDDLDNARSVSRQPNLSVINEIHEINSRINSTKQSIELIEKRRELERADIRDKIFANFGNIENKLYNSSFKDGVMKELAGLFYEARD